VVVWVASGKLVYCLCGGETVDVLALSGWHLRQCERGLLMDSEAAVGQTGRDGNGGRWRCCGVHVYKLFLFRQQTLEKNIFGDIYV